MKDENGKEINEEEFLIVRNQLRDEILKMFDVPSLFTHYSLGGRWANPKPMELENIVF